MRKTRPGVRKDLKVVPGILRKTDDLVSVEEVLSDLPKVRSLLLAAIKEDNVIVPGEHHSTLVSDDGQNVMEIEPLTKIVPEVGLSSPERGGGTKHFAYMPNGLRDFQIFFIMSIFAWLWPISMLHQCGQNRIGSNKESRLLELRLA
ncbi:MAG: hypothetical protein ABSE08_05965 [Syntrophobacteraceae bacterium]